MENKEPKIFKTLVHRETGEWGHIEEASHSEECFMANETTYPDLYIDLDTKSIELVFGVDLTDYKVQEVVILSLEEYERLKQYEEAYDSLK